MPDSDIPVEHDYYGLSRFVEAQAATYRAALSELQDGRKRSHWMWYIFPQYKGLGHSAMSMRYAIKSGSEAQAYLRHPVLGPRLIECAETVLAINGKTATEIFGTPDDMKLKSCATLFDQFAPDHDSVFERLLGKYFDGAQDRETLQRLREIGT